MLTLYDMINRVKYFMLCIVCMSCCYFWTSQNHKTFKVGVPTVCIGHIILKQKPQNFEDKTVILKSVYLLETAKINPIR